MVFGHAIKHLEHNAHRFHIPHQETGCGGYKSGFHLQHNHTGSSHDNHGTTTLSYGGGHLGFDVSWNTVHTHSQHFSSSGVTGAHTALHICF